MLTPQQRTTYREDGYLVLPGFKSHEAMAALRARATAIVEAFDPAESQSIFTTNDQTRTADAYFMGSADTIRCFFEEEAFAEGGPRKGQLKQAKALSINKIGHAMHDLDPVFAAFSHGPALAELAADLGLIDPQIWQSQYIFKQPGIGGEVRWHQDATFFETAPQSVTTFWFALEDATVDNGCLWAEPGGHRGRRGVLRERFVRTSADAASGDNGAINATRPTIRPAISPVAMETLDATPWPDQSSAVALEVAAGTLIVFHGLLPHYSAANRSPHSRHAYTLHATDGRAAYSARNWLQRNSGLPVRGF